MVEERERDLTYKEGGKLKENIGLELQNGAE